MPDKTAEEAAVPCPSAPSSQISICLNLLAHIQEQIRAADSKAGFISMLNVFLFGFIATNFEKICSLYDAGKSPGAVSVALAVSVVSVYMLFTVASFILAVTCVMSRFGQRGVESRVFFGHIAKRHGSNPGKYANVVCKMTDHEWVEELSNQIAEVSTLAVIKHNRIRWATITTLASVLLWLMALVTIVGVRWLKG